MLDPSPTEFEAEQAEALVLAKTVADATFSILLNREPAKQLARALLREHELRVEAEREPKLVAYGDLAPSMVERERAEQAEARVGRLEEALRKIEAESMRFHPIAGYQFDTDVRKIARRALEPS